MKAKQVGRKYLTEPEVKEVVASARKVGRCGPRDGLMILMAFRHGLRCLEVVDLKWDQVHLDKAAIEMRRAKRGKPAMHELTRSEVKLLRKLPGARERKGYVFVCAGGGRQGEKLSQRSFHRVVARAGRLAGLPFEVRPHMLRHACGHYLAAKGVDTRRIQDYLGHRNIQHTVGYTALAPGRFVGFFDD